MNKKSVASDAVKPLQPYEVALLSASFSELSHLAEAALSYLPSDRQQRLVGMRCDRLRKRAILSSFLARYALALHTAGSISALTISQDSKGKPRLAAADYGFSVSHSGDCLLVAVGRSVEIGVDVESLARTVDYLAIARRYFHPDEYQWLGQRAGPALRDAFFDLWVKKEAAVKAQGQGITYGFDRFKVAQASPATLELNHQQGGVMALTLIAVAGAMPDYRAALAVSPQLKHLDEYTVNAAHLAAFFQD